MSNNGFQNNKNNNININKKKYSNNPYKININLRNNLNNNLLKWQFYNYISLYIYFKILYI